MDTHQERKILIVEDEMIIAMDIQNTLNYLGYKQTSIAESGEAALLVVTRDPPDLVLMDIGLNGSLDGIETAEQIRQVREELPVLFLTSYSNTKIKERATVIPHSGYLLKPFTSDILGSAVNIALTKSA
jgi:CheY-like chemotaxis protein